MKALSILLLYILGAQAHAGLTTKPVPSQDGPDHLYYCETGRDKIVCTKLFSDNRSSEWKTAELRGMRQPLTNVVGDGFHCVLTVDRVQCWIGQVEPGAELRETTVPALKNPRQISGGGKNVCALDDSGMHCWTYANGATPTVLKIPELKNPRYIAAGKNLFCALHEPGAKCWRPSDLFEESMQHLTLEWVKNPTKIGVGDDCACLTNEKEGPGHNWICADRFGHNQAGPSGRAWDELHLRRDFSAFAARPVVNKQNPEFNLDQIDYLNDLLIKIAPPVQTRFLRAIGESAMTIAFGPGANDQSRYLVLRLMEPAIQSNTSTYFAGKLLPAYNTSLASIERELGMQNISKIERSNVNREAALRILHSAFTVLVEFVDLNEKRAYAHIPRLIGQAIANAQNTQALTDAIDQIAPQLQRMESSSKAAFLVKTIYLAQEWLRR